MESQPTQARCPLCGEANGCALARDPAQPVSACWCASRTFPASLLARAPGSSSCVCEACLLRETQEAGATGETGTDFPDSS